MEYDRRAFLKTSLMTSALASCRPADADIFTGTATQALGIPGPFPGRVVSVNHPASILSRKYQREPVRQMIHQGLMKLTGAETPAEAWRYFFEPGDVVGIKLNPVGQPYVMSSAEVVQEIIAGLNMAGVPARDIVAYDRYRRQFLDAGFDTWLPEGVRWTGAVENYDGIQTDMDGYDPDHFVELPLVHPRVDPDDPHNRRSYAARFLTQDINKMINLCVLKHHQSAGVTLALKNLSHGMVNNVSRSHSSSTLNACGTFIPAIVDMPIIREKVVLNILDGVLGAYHGGPGGKIKNYVWAHQTMYFSTDPVALDKIGWGVIDEKRQAMGMEPVGKAEPDADSQFYRMQPEHVEIAAALGLGVFADNRIEHVQVGLN